MNSLVLKQNFKAFLICKSGQLAAQCTVCTLSHTSPFSQNVFFIAVDKYTRKLHQQRTQIRKNRFYFKARNKLAICKARSNSTKRAYIYIGL